MKRQQNGILRMVDLIQHRYGWTDEVVFSLPYARFLDVADLLIELKQEEEAESYRKHAFTAYLMSGQEGVGFADYLDALGLGHSATTKQEDKTMNADQAVEHAKSILEKFQSKKIE